MPQPALMDVSRNLCHAHMVYNVASFQHPIYTVYQTPAKTSIYVTAFRVRKSRNFGKECKKNDRKDGTPNVKREIMHRKGTKAPKVNYHAARFLDCVDQPSISSPLLPTLSPSTLIPFMPGVSSSQVCAAIPPALARLSGMSSSMGLKKAEMRFASSSLKWYFSRKTSVRAQWRRR